MPPKLLDRRSSFSSTSSLALASKKDSKGPVLTDTSYNGKGRSVPVSKDGTLHALETKPCVTCGREITPRSKWANEWSEIKYCSVACRGWKSVVKVGEASEFKQSVNSSKAIGMLERCLVGDEASKGPPRKGETSLYLHIDAWIEGTMMHLINSKEPQYTSMTKQTGGIPLSEVSKSMHQELDQHRHVNEDDPTATTIPPYINLIRDQVLTHKPGEREKIRRAARRLVVFPLETSYFAKLFGTETGELHPIALSQKDGQRRLETLDDVSYAKMEIYISRKVL